MKVNVAVRRIANMPLDAFHRSEFLIDGKYNIPCEALIWICRILKFWRFGEVRGDQVRGPVIFFGIEVRHPSCMFSEYSLDFICLISGNYIPQIDAKYA